MGRKEAIGLSLLAALNAGCGGEEPKKAFLPPSAPKDIAADRDWLMAQAFNCDGRLAPTRTRIDKLYATGLLGPKPPAHTEACTADFLREGNPVFGVNAAGFVEVKGTDADGKPSVTREARRWKLIPPNFFGPDNTPCEQATALTALDLCAARKDCDAYNGPESPYLPYEVQEQARKILSVCERMEDGLITADGLVFEGTVVDKPLGKEYTGTVMYKDGGKVEGTFIKEADNFKPVGPATVTWPSGLTLKISPDWDDSTEEDATYQMPGDDPITLTADPTLPDGNWTFDDDPSDFAIETDKYDWPTRAFTVSYQTLSNPSGVEYHSITDAELSTYTGYGRYTNFDEASKLKGYEGGWNAGKFEGKGTLRTRSNQTIQAEFTAGVPDACCELKFKSTSDAGALKELIPLPDKSGWVVSSQVGDEWDKYVWDDTEKKLVIKKMVNP